MLQNAEAMARRRFSFPRHAAFGVGVAIFMLAVPWTRTASAAPKDDAALALAKEAIEVDFLATSFAKAKEKLDKALVLCKGNACSAAVRAKLHGAAAVVAVTGLKQADDAKRHLVEALKADPNVTLDADLTTPEVQAALDAAKKELGIAATSTTTAPPGGAPASAAAESEAAPEAAKKPKAEAGADRAQAAEGDMTHEPPAEQAVRTPVPIYVELPSGVTATKVYVRYRPFGSNAWKSVDMTRMRDGWGAEIPCLDVGSATGNLQYFVQALDAKSEIAAFSGTRNAPHMVPIKNELEGEPPHLPGKPPAAQCADRADCPPGFPGCKTDAMADQAGEGGEHRGSKPASENYLSAGIQQDILFLPSATQVCTNDAEYYCFYANPDSYYNGQPYPQGGNEVAGGANFATTRFLLGYDRVIGSMWTLGLRLGYAIRGGPQAPDGKAFLPIHAEGRVTMYFTKDALAKPGFRPYVHLAGGLAEVDGRVLVTVYQTQADYTADKRTTLNAWRKTGTTFAALGGGAMYALTPTSGPYLDVRVMQLFGVSGTSISPQVGYAFGL